MILDFHTHAVRLDPDMPEGYRAFMSSNQEQDLDEFCEY